MIRVAFGQLRHRIGRTLALLLAIAAATGSFVLLTGAVETTRLAVRGTVEQNFRSSYDLLVRPRTSYTPLETEQGLVRPNYQSGIFGGITTADLAAIRAVPGVEVAAPVGNLGYVPLEGLVEVPLQQYLTSDRQQLFRIRPTWSADRGLSRFPGAPSYVYVSRNPTTVVPRVAYTRGFTNYRENPIVAEVVPGRRTPVPACSNYEVDLTGRWEESGNTSFPYRDPYGADTVRIACFYTDRRSVSVGDALGASDWSALSANVWVSYPVLLTAVDPDAEAQLSGLDSAVTSGRMLTAEDRPTPGEDGRSVQIPVLAATRLDLDETVSATVERVEAPTRGKISDAFTGERGVVARVARLPGTPVGSFGPVASSRGYENVLEQGGIVNTYWTVGPSTYAQQSSGLQVRSVSRAETLYGDGSFALALPVGSDDRGFRTLDDRWLHTTEDTYPAVDVVGRFDPQRATPEGKLSGLTAATYVSPSLPGADPASRAALGGRGLAPSTNLAGYAAQPPTLLTTFAGAAPLLSQLYQGASPKAPIGVVRVRVAGLTGTDPVSRERLNSAALAITRRTGLAVDIVAGASGVPTTVVLPAGRHGRPELRLLEQWARKGVAYEVVDAVDRKSLALFGLILAVCALVVGNAASAAVRTRRTELGVLSCLGWGAHRLFGVVQVELALIGLVAGLLGAGAAAGVARGLGLAVPLERAAWAVPAAVLLAALAGLAPAFRAARAVPMQAVRPQVVAPRRARTLRTLAGFSLRALRRTPGRTALGAASLAVGVAAATFLLAVQYVFRGVVVGSLLGDAVTVQVRTPDLIALGAIVVLGAVGVADVLYLAVREQAGELAVLRAAGWTDAALTRIVLGQGVGMGLLGGLLGAAAGCLAVARFAGALPAELIVLAGVCAAAGVGVAAVAAVVPAVLLRRLPVPALLAEET